MDKKIPDILVSKLHQAKKEYITYNVQVLSNFPEESARRGGPQVLQSSESLQIL